MKFQKLFYNIYNMSMKVLYGKRANTFASHSKSLIFLYSDKEIEKLLLDIVIRLSFDNMDEQVC